MSRKCDGLAKTPELLPHIRTANVILTRYQTATLLPKLAKLLESLPNLHTLHIFHAHTAMTTAIKEGFKDVTLSNVYTIVLLSQCHEVLRRCPNVKSVWGQNYDNSKIISAIAKNCKMIEELHYVNPLEENQMKKLVKAAPNLQLFEFRYHAEAFLKNIASFKNLNMIIFEPSKSQELQDPDVQLEEYLSKLKAKLKNLPESKEKIRLRLFIKGDSENGRLLTEGSGRYIDVNLD